MRTHIMSPHARVAAMVCDTSSSLVARVAIISVAKIIGISKTLRRKAYGVAYQQQ